MENIPEVGGGSKVPNRNNDPLIARVDGSNETVIVVTVGDVVEDRMSIVGVDVGCDVGEN